MTTEEISIVRWELLHDSPFQYRQTYDEARLAELAASIRDTGRIQQPLVVRRRFPNPLFRDAYDPQDGYELVFGHRRKRAGQAAGLEGAPCIVRDMTDEEVKKAQLAENIQREDVHPIEEAQGFDELLRHHQVTADDLAEQIGKSRSYVYGRLKLLALCPEVRKACLAGEIGSEVGLLIARLRTTKLQEKALGYIKGKYLSLEDGGKESFRRIKSLLNERFTLGLAKAPFDTTDEMLVPLAGACGRCPKRSGNAPEFEDVARVDDDDSLRRREWLAHAGPDVCTDPDCFAAKKTADLKRKAAALEAQGKVVIDGNKARQAIDAYGNVKGAYVAVKDLKATLKEAGVKGANLAMVTIQDPRTGKTVDAVKADDLKAAGVKAPESRASANGIYAKQQERWRKEQEANERKAKAEQVVRLQVLDAITAAMATTARDAFDLQLLARTAWAGVDWHGQRLMAKLLGAEDVIEVRKAIGQMDVPSLTLFAMRCSLISQVAVQVHELRHEPTDLLAAAAHYGVDVEAIRAQAKAQDAAASTPSSAARAPKGAKGKATVKKAALAKKKPRAPLVVGDASAPDDDGLFEQGQTDDAGVAGERSASEQVH